MKDSKDGKACKSTGAEADEESRWKVGCEECRWRGEKLGNAAVHQWKEYYATTTAGDTEHPLEH